MSLPSQQSPREASCTLRAPDWPAGGGDDRCAQRFESHRELVGSRLAGFLAVPGPVPLRSSAARRVGVAGTHTGAQSVTVIVRNRGHTGSNQPPASRSERRGRGCRGSPARAARNQLRRGRGQHSRRDDTQHPRPDSVFDAGDGLPSICRASVDRGEGRGAFGGRRFGYRPVPVVDSANGRVFSAHPLDRRTAQGCERKICSGPRHAGAD